MISIIIPTYRRYKFIRNALETILSQSLSNFECLIIDDDLETDDLKVTLKNICFIDKRFKIYKRPNHLQKGPSACRNYGMSLAKGEYIQFFDDDDEMYLNMLGEKLRKIEEENFDVVVSSLEIFNVKEKKVISQNKIFSNKIIEDYVLGNITWYVSGPLWKKEFLTEHFDEKIQTLDDWDFNLRNLYNKPKMGFIENPLQKYNRYGIERTLSTKKISEGTDQSRSAFLVYKKHYNILLEKRIMTSELKNCLLGRIVFLLRQSLVRKNETSGDILNFLMDKKWDLNKTKLLKIVVGFYSFKFFNMGYRFLKY